MIRPLRNYHYVAWRVLAVLLPILFTLALWVRPNITSSIIGAKGEAFSTRIENNSDSTMVISITIGQPLQVPSCVAILSSPSSNIILGVLGGERQYSFTVPRVGHETTLNLMDAVHWRTIKTIPLENSISQ